MLRKLLFIPPILVGIAVLVYAAGSRHGPERKPQVETSRAVRVIIAEPVDLVPRVTGFGSVYPKTVWNAIAQVAGEVVAVHPDLERGAILPAGTELVRISPADFDLAISQAEANIRAAEARLAELNVTEANTADLLQIEKRGLELREAELVRQQRLFERGTVARSSVDLEQRETLAQRKRVQDLENTLRLLPTQRTVQREQIAVYRAQLDAAKLDLERTHIALPFDARIAEVNVEAKQYVQTGSTLVMADSMDVAEVEAQIPIARFRAAMEAGAPEGLPVGVTVSSFSRITAALDLQAVVRLRAGDAVIEWPARFVRISDSVDPKTRTVGVIVAVDEPYAKAVPGKRPPLAKGMFVEIEIRTRARPTTIVVPRTALHDGALYVVADDDRLETRPVTVGLRQDDFAVVVEGLSAGDRIVVSDLVPAVAGMLLDPRPDAEVQARLTAAAAGSASQP